MKTSSSIWRYAAIIAGLVIMVLLIKDFNSRMADLRRLSVEREQVSLQVTSMVETRVYLETQIAYAKSDEAVDEWAYQEGRMAKPGDVVVVPLEGGGEQLEQAVTLLPAPRPVSNWQLWLSLFVDQVDHRANKVDQGSP